MKFRQLDKILKGRLLSSRLVMLIDLLVSAFASLSTVILMRFFFHCNPSSLIWLSGSLVFSAIAFYLFRTYRIVIRHSSLREVGTLIFAVLLKTLLLFLSLYIGSPAGMFKYILAAILLDFTLTVFYLLAVRVLMVYAYSLVRNTYIVRKRNNPVLIYGTDEKSLALAMRFKNSTNYEVLGLLDFGARNKKLTLSGYRVYKFSDRDDFKKLVATHALSSVLFATSEKARLEANRLLLYLSELKIKALIAPPLDEVGDASNGRMQSVREVNIEDLLGRPEIKVSMDEIIAAFKDKVVMVTGGAGSIGSELCRQLATFGIRRLVIFDNAETPVHNIRLELEERFPNLDFVPVIGDVRMPSRLDFAFRTYRPQIVFHAAAYKHVPLMEENPCEAVLVNVAGTRNVADKCIEYDVEKMVMVSTDKAVNPTNVMGCTKRLAEIYVQSLGLGIERGNLNGRTKFVTTRFGNVLGSNGSVIPRFREQIAHGGPVTVTHPDITRFFMTIPEACRLVMEAATMTCGNQIFVFDMGESVKIDHLARRMIELAGLVPDRDIKIAYTGLRPGEKLYEEVLSSAENTQPTQHDRIRIAQVREYDYADAVKAVDNLERLSRDVRIIEMVKYMKAIVPEYKSQNSQFEKLDTQK